MKADACEFRANPGDDLAKDQEVSIREELLETFSPQPIVTVPSAHDGMPIPAQESTQLALAPPFTRETVVCVEDDTEYVELFSDELLEFRGWNPSTEQPLLYCGDTVIWGDLHEARCRFDTDGTPRKRERFSPEQVVKRFGVFVARYERDGRTAHLAVRPRRERCEFMQRQVMANDEQPNRDDFGHYVRYYNCTKRRSVGGAFMSLRDTAVYACDYRRPNDPDSIEQFLDSFDRKRLGEKRHLEMVPLFNLD